MMNVIEIKGVKALIQYDPDIDMFRGEFMGLSGGADFYAADVESLKKEGRISLKVFLDMCKEDGVDPFKNFSGKFNVRIDPGLHEQAVTYAKSQRVSLNDFVNDAIIDSLPKAE